MIFYRPVDGNELLALYRSGMRAFAPKKRAEPTFYAVRDRALASRLAREWHATQAARMGFVVRLVVGDDFASRHTVGDEGSVSGGTPGELWVPAEELPALDEQLVVPANVVEARYGRDFKGRLSTSGPLSGLGSGEQFWWLHQRLAAKDFESFRKAITASHGEIFLHYEHWKRLRGPEAPPKFTAAKRARLLEAIRDVWSEQSPGLLLGVPRPRPPEGRGRPKAARRRRSPGRR